MTAQIAATEARLAAKLDALGSDQQAQINRTVAQYVEAKMAAYAPFLDEIVARRALHADIIASPKHDAYYRGYLEVMNGVFQAAMVTRTDLVALRSTTAASKIGAAVANLGSLLSSTVPVGGQAIGLATTVLAFFLSRLGEKEQRVRLARLTEAYPNPTLWFDAVERAAAQITTQPEKWAQIGKLSIKFDHSTSARVTGAFKDLFATIETQPQQGIWQQAAAADALAALELLMTEDTPLPKTAAGLAEVLAAQACTFFAVGPGPGRGVRVAVSRVAGAGAGQAQLIVVPADLDGLKRAAGAKLGIAVSSLYLRDKFAVSDLSTLKDLDELTALTAEEEADRAKLASARR